MGFSEALQFFAKKNGLRFNKGGLFSSENVVGEYEGRKIRVEIDTSVNGFSNVKFTAFGKNPNIKKKIYIRIQRSAALGLPQDDTAEIGERIGLSEFQKSFGVSSIDMDYAKRLIDEGIQKRILECDPRLFPNWGNPIISIEPEKVVLLVTCTYVDVNGWQIALDLSNHLVTKTESTA